MIPYERKQYLFKEMWKSVADQAEYIAASYRGLRDLKERGWNDIRARGRAGSMEYPQENWCYACDAMLEKSDRFECEKGSCPILLFSNEGYGCQEYEGEYNPYRELYLKCREYTIEEPFDAATIRRIATDIAELKWKSKDHWESPVWREKEVL